MSLGDKQVMLKHIAMAGIACIVAFTAAYGMIEATNQNTICGEQCHEMDPMYVTWQHSNHKQLSV